MTDTIDCRTDLNIPHAWINGNHGCIYCGALRSDETGETVEPSTTCVVSVTIGNTDNKLTQAGWSHFFQSVENLVQQTATQVHGVFVSPSTSKYQNASFLFELDDDKKEAMQAALSRLAAVYFQDSIAWLEGETQFITAAKVKSSD